MPDGAEAVDGLAADALRGAVGGDLVGVQRLERLQLLEQEVELDVGDFRAGLDVILVVVVVR